MAKGSWMFQVHFQLSLDSFTKPNARNMEGHPKYANDTTQIPKS